MKKPEKLKVLAFFCLNFFIQGLCFSQLIFRDTGTKTNPEELEKMYSGYIAVKDSLAQKKFNFFYSHILEIENKKYLLPDGHFNVYEWQGDTWNNIYTGPFFGYNFYSKKFVHDQKIYSFGGYGYWRNHGQVIQFIPERGEWELVKFTENLSNSFAFTTEKGLHLIGKSSKLVDFASKKIRDYPELSIDKNYDPYTQYTTSLELDSFYLCGIKPHYLIQKYTNDVLITDLQPFKSLFIALHNPLDFVYTFQDTIVVISEQRKIKDTLDVKEHLPFFVPYRDGPPKSIYLWLLAGVLPLGFVWLK